MTMSSDEVASDVPRGTSKPRNNGFERTDCILPPLPKSALLVSLHSLTDDEIVSRPENEGLLLKETHAEENPENDYRVLMTHSDVSHRVQQDADFYL